MTTTHESERIADFQGRRAQWIAADVANLGPTKLWLCGHRLGRGVKRNVPGRQPLLWRCWACHQAAKEAK